MIITTRARYGLRLLVDIAQHPGSCQLSQVARRQHVGLPYLRQLSLLLSRAGFLSSTKGRGGGVQLARPAGEITMKDVFTALEGDICLTPPSAHESPYATCLRMFLYEKVDGQLGAMMEKVTLADLISSPRNFMI